MIRRSMAWLAGGAVMSLLLLLVPSVAGADPSGEAAYADGQTYWMHSTQVVTGASSGLLSAPPIYILGFTPPGSTPYGPITLLSGYQPQCNPCLQEPVAYHDHLLTGEPGSGTNGTAGDYRSPWRVVIMHYNPTYSNSLSFQPVKSDDDLAAAEANGEFLRINNSGQGNPYEILTDKVLICPLVQVR
jgi:hypothetical protein